MATAHLFQHSIKSCLIIISLPFWEGSKYQQGNMETKLADYSKTETPERKKVNITFLPQNIIVEGEEGSPSLRLPWSMRLNLIITVEVTAPARLVM